MSSSQKWTSPFKREDIVKAFFDLDLSSSEPSPASKTPKPRERNRPALSKPANEAKKKNKISLLTLPVEIRLQIYDLLLVHEKPLQIKPDEDEKQVELAILQTCKQVYHEASPILYSQNIFAATDPEDIFLLLLYIGLENFRLIKHLDFYVPWPSSLPPWLRLFRTLAMEASGLRSLSLDLDVNFDYNEHHNTGTWWGGLGDKANFVRALGKIQGLEDLSIKGYYAKTWPEYLEKKMGVRVRAISGHGYELSEFMEFIDKEFEDRVRNINEFESMRFQEYQYAIGATQ